MTIHPSTAIGRNDHEVSCYLLYVGLMISKGPYNYEGTLVSWNPSAEEGRFTLGGRV